MNEFNWRNDLLTITEREQPVRVIVVGDPIADHNVLLRESGGRQHVAAETWRCGGAAAVASLVKGLGGRHVLFTEKEVYLGFANLPAKHWERKHRFYSIDCQVPDLLFACQDTYTYAPLAVDDRLHWQADAIVLADYGKGTLTQENCPAIIAKARELGVPVVVDPNPKLTDWTRYEGANVIKATANEWLAVDQTAAMDRIFEVVSCVLSSAVVITDGCHGSKAYQGDQAWLFPARPRHTPIDCIGCGDTFAAALAVALGAGLALSAACRLANAIAGYQCEHLGVRDVFWDQLTDDDFAGE